MNENSKLGYGNLNYFPHIKIKRIIGIIISSLKTIEIVVITSSN